MEGAHSDMLNWKPKPRHFKHVTHTHIHIQIQIQTALPPHMKLSIPQKEIIRAHKKRHSASLCWMYFILYKSRRVWVGVCVCVLPPLCLYKYQAEELPLDWPAVANKETVNKLATRLQPWLLLRIQFDIIQFPMRMSKHIWHTYVHIMFGLSDIHTHTHTRTEESFFKWSEKNKKKTLAACQIILQIVKC